MRETEVIIFIVLITLVCMVFVVATIALVLQYRKKKIIYDAEKRMADELHKNELLNVKVEVQEETMQHIGVEIHDSVTQKLGLVSLHLQQIEYENRFPELNSTLTMVNSLVGESLDDLRLLSHRLLKHKEDETDIVACLGRECERLRLLKVCDISFRSNSSAVFVDTYLVHTALRILQESLQNSLKHSGCRHICISLENRNDKLVLSVKDDGRGFDMKAATQGVGLRNIKRRADIIGALVKQESVLGMGTQLKLEIPTEGKQ